MLGIRIRRSTRRATVPSRLAAGALALALGAALGPAAAAGAGTAEPAGDTARTSGLTTTLDPIGGGYTPVSLRAFASNAAVNASPPTVDILVSPAAYGTKPSIEENFRLAKSRAHTIQHACNQAVGDQGLTCVARAVRMFSRKDVKDPRLIARIEDPNLDGIYFLGGNQATAMQVMAASPAEAAMADAYARGVVVGGTSAGDAVESLTMITGYNEGYESPTALQEAAPIVWWPDGPNPKRRGLSFGSETAVFDQHFYERGRLPRLLNVTAQSADRYGGAGLLGFGFDYGTGARVEDDASLTGPFGSSSLAIVDLATAGASHRWVGNDRTLSERNTLTHIVAPGDDVTFDVATRTVRVRGGTVPFRSPGPWRPSLLADPAAGRMLLGGDLSRPGPSKALNRFVTLAQTSGLDRLVVLLAAYADDAAARKDARAYLANLRTAGWHGAIQRVLYPQNPLPSLDGAAGALLAGGDASLLATALDQRLRSFVASALARAPVVLTDQAMTQAMGRAYAANPNVPGDELGGAAMHRFRSDNARVRDGLGYLPGAMFVPRLAEDRRWGQLYGLTIRRPDLIAFGIEEGTAIELHPGDGAVAVGGLSIVVVDGRAATAMDGSNGAFTDLNVLLHTYAAGEQIRGPS